MLRARLREQLRPYIDDPQLTVGQEPEDAALERVLDSILDSSYTFG